ncbi:MAG: polysaccharide biosynthesis/export family protein [Salinivirgaceae bacterium]|nr:polysaccharide biosynthesis/export family protein [Salinivirgaceae bacterium]
MKALKTKIIYVIIIGALLFSSCIRQQKTWILQDSNSAETQFANTKKTAYKIQSGDNIYINIYSTDKATSAYFQSNLPTLMNQTYLYLNSYVVNEDGYLTFSFIDKMYVKDLSVEQVQKQLQTTMNTFFKDVTVSVKMVSYVVSVLGEVEDPSKFNVPEEQINVLEAVAICGGFKDYANRADITLVRQTSTGSETVQLNLQDKNILSSDYFYLMPNDVIYVPSLKSKSYTYEKMPYGLFISTISIVIAVLAITM